MQEIKAIGETTHKLELQFSKTPNLGQIRFLEPCDLEIWWTTFKNNVGTSRLQALCRFS